MLANVVNYAKWAFLIFMMLGERVFAYIGKPVPDWYLGMKQKSWMYMMGAFFFTNMVYTSLVSTGAFEIYVDG